MFTLSLKITSKNSTKVRAARAVRLFFSSVNQWRRLWRCRHLSFNSLLLGLDDWSIQKKKSASVITRLPFSTKRFRGVSALPEKSLPFDWLRAEVFQLKIWNTVEQRYFGVPREINVRKISRCSYIEKSLNVLLFLFFSNPLVCKWQLACLP